jgi:cbb3-type cytochrome oxidase subunit 1
MDKFAKGFVIMSIIYLGLATFLGIAMLWHHDLLAVKFVHSHLNMLGWVSMMIYGVGYHILPRFMGRPVYSVSLGNVQFWLANIGLVVMLLFYTLNVYRPSQGYLVMTVLGGVMQGVSIFLFFYNMLRTMLVTQEQPH